MPGLRGCLGAMRGAPAGQEQGRTQPRTHIWVQTPKISRQEGWGSRICIRAGTSRCWEHPLHAHILGLKMPKDFPGQAPGVGRARLTPKKSPTGQEAAPTPWGEQHQTPQDLAPAP